MLVKDRDSKEQDEEDTGNRTGKQEKRLNACNIHRGGGSEGSSAWTQCRIEYDWTLETDETASNSK